MSKYYHCSSLEFVVGTILVGNDYGPVFLSDDPHPHHTIDYSYGDREDGGYGAGETWYVYEVKPNGLLQYGFKHEELMCSSAEVLACLGKVKDLFPDKQVSRVNPLNHPQLEIVENGDKFGCRDPVDYLVKEAFYWYESEDDDWINIIEDALRLLDGLNPCTSYGKYAVSYYT